MFRAEEVVEVVDDRGGEELRAPFPRDGWTDAANRARAAVDVPALYAALASVGVPGADVGDGAAVVDAVLGGFNAALGADPAAALRNYADYSIPPNPEADPAVPEPKAAVIMLLVLTDPSAAERAAHHFRSWQETLERTHHDAAAYTARYLADGWWFASAFGLGAVPAQDHARVRGELLRLLAGPTSTGG